MRRGSALVAAATFAVALAGSAGDWARIVAPLEIELPRDHGAHPGFRTEWWYATATLTGPRGERYGVQLTFFRRGLEPGEADTGEPVLKARQILAAHLAVADVTHGTFRYAERLRRLTPGLAAASETDLDLVLDGWTMRRGDGDRLELHAHDRATGIGLDLALVPTKPLVRNGEGGLSRKGPEPGNASAYLSWTRLAATGTVRVGGRDVPVRGEGWFDHEWGTSQLGAGVVGWSWFGLRLADGRDLMLFTLRHADGSTDPYSAGTLVAPDGTTRHLAAADFEIETLARWGSRVSGASYPSRWRLHLPSAGIDIEVRPWLGDCEIAARSTGTVYWEGQVSLSGSTGGEGYAELTGYAGSIAGRF